MKIVSLKIKNVKSFRDEVSINFKEGINIFIGPNAGGKSNLLDIVNVTLLHFFTHSWEVTKEKIPPENIYRRRIERINPSSDITHRLDKHMEKLTDEQVITIAFKVTEEDIKNIEIIRDNIDKLREFEIYEYGSHYIDNFVGQVNLIQDIKPYVQSVVKYSIKNYTFQYQQSNQEFAKLFLKYLNYLELFSILIEEFNNKYPSQKIERLSPVVLYFSPYRTANINTLQVTLSGKNKPEMKAQYRRNTSKDVTTIFPYAGFYFAGKFRDLNDDLQKFEEDPEVKLVNQLIKKIGYTHFAFEVIDKYDNVYQIEFYKSNTKIDITKASSGEKEILGLLLGLFAFNIHNGVIIIDEPDLHLHPKWQKILMELFLELSNKNQIQFFIVTHSPHFITPHSIQNTFRVYKENNTSKVFIPAENDSNYQNVKDIFQIINTLNNEKIFFADKIVLVEGVTDQIVFEKILKVCQKGSRIPSDEIIEIINVNGKNNFAKFRTFLDTWRIKNYIIADLDYVANIADETLKKQIAFDLNEIKRSLDNKNSMDAKELLKKLDNILSKESNEITERDLEDLGSLWNHIKNRHLSLRDITSETKTQIEKFIDSQYSKNIFILKKGELEDYFDISPHLDIQKAIEKAEQIQKENIDPEIKNIFNKILNDSEA